MSRRVVALLECEDWGMRRSWEDGAVEPAEQTLATAVGPDRRWPEAIWWSVVVLVPAVVVARLGDNGPVILGLGIAIAGAVFVAFLRAKPTVVTRDEIRLPKRTIRRQDVARVTRSDETTAFVFRDADGGIVGLVDLFELSGKFRDALQQHGWPVAGVEA